MDQIITFIAFVLIIGVIVFIHELGHFTAAKLVGVHVEEFALGFGKNLISKKWRGTVYKLNLLPIGGYVSLEGEGEVADPKKSSRNYANKPLIAKLFILFAGVIMNFVLACVLFSTYLVINNYQTSLLHQADYQFIGIDQAASYPSALVISSTIKGTPADSKLNPGDVVVTLNGEKIATTADFQAYIKQNPNSEIALGLVNEQGEMTKTVMIQLQGSLKVKVTDPATGTEKEVDSVLGATFAPFYILKYPATLLSGIPHGINVLGYQLKVLGDLISSAVQQSNAGVVVDQLTSVVGVGAVVSDIVSLRQFTELLNLTGVISIALAFFNVLPIPALDGGQAAILLVERLRGKPLSPRTQGIINTAAIAFLLIFGVIVMFKDVIQFQVFDGIISWVRGVLGR